LNTWGISHRSNQGCLYRLGSGFDTFLSPILAP
jgi:hypothetical protein